MGADSSGLDGDTSTTSHFVGFRLSPLSTANLHTVLICSCKVARELLMVRISSAWMKAPAYVPPTDGPNPLLCRDFRRGSMISKKRAGERTEPWRTPRSRLNTDDKEPFTLTIHFGDIYQLRISLQALPSIPASYRRFRRTEYWMESNAFCKS